IFAAESETAQVCQDLSRSNVSDLRSRPICEAILRFLSAYVNPCLAAGREPMSTNIAATSAVSTLLPSILTPKKAYTYRDLETFHIENLKKDLAGQEYESQILSNHRTVLRSWTRQFGYSEDSVIGRELDTEFPSRLETYLTAQK